MEKLTINVGSFKERFLKLMKEDYPEFKFDLVGFPIEETSGCYQLLLKVTSKQLNYRNDFYLTNAYFDNPKIVIDYENKDGNEELSELYEEFPEAYYNLVKIYEELKNNDSQPGNK